MLPNVTSLYREIVIIHWGSREEIEMVVKTDSEWISLPEAARELGVTWATAWNALLRGRLDGQKRGRVWVVRCSSV